MLSVLAFKKSLFAGVLDGGEHEVFLQGTRLSQFMKSVEQVAPAVLQETSAHAPARPARKRQSPSERAAVCGARCPVYRDGMSCECSWVGFVADSASAAAVGPANAWLLRPFV